MNKRQNSVLSCIERVLAFLKANQDYVNTKPSLVLLQKELIAIKGQIIALREQQQTDLSGLYTEKIQDRATLIALAILASNALVAYYTSIGNSVEAQKARFVPTDLSTESDQNCLNDCKLIYNLTKSNIQNLTVFDYSDANLTELETGIQNFESIMQTPKQAQKDKSVFTLKISACFNQVATLFNSMDIFVETLVNTKPDFYTNYTKARIIEYQKGSLQFKARVTDAEGNPINKAKLAFQLKGTTVLERLTAEKGGCAIKNLAEGTYTVIISMIGYQTQTITVYISLAKTTKLAIALVKL